MKAKNVMKALSVVFALALVVALGLILRAPEVKAEETVVEVYLNGNFDNGEVERDTEAPLGSENNPFEYLGQVRDYALNAKGILSDIDNTDRVIIHVTGDSRNGSLAAQNSCIGGFSAYYRTVTQDHAHNTAMSTSNYNQEEQREGVETAKRVMMELRGEPCGEDPGTGDPLYPTIYYTSNQDYLIQADDYTYSNISFKHMRWNWSADGLDELENTLGVLPDTITPKNVIQLIVFADKCIIGENVHFYGCAITGDGTDREVEDTEGIHFWGGYDSVSGNYLNECRIPFSKVYANTGTVSQDTRDKMVENTRPNTTRYTHNRGRQIEITSGTWGQIWLLGQDRHTYSEGTSIDLKVTGVTCSRIWLGKASCEILADDEGNRLTVTLTVENCDVGVNSDNSDDGRIAIFGSPSPAVYLQNGELHVLADHNTTPEFNYVLNVGEGNNVGKPGNAVASHGIYSAPLQTDDVVYPDLTVTRGSITWTGDCTINYNASSYAANAFTSPLIMRSNGNVTNKAIVVKGKQTLNLTGTATVDGLFYAVRTTGVRIGTGGSIEININGNINFGGSTGNATKTVASGFAGIGAFVTAPDFEGAVPVAINIKSGTYAFLSSVCNFGMGSSGTASSYIKAADAPLMDLTLDIGTDPALPAPVINNLCLVNHSWDSTGSVWKAFTADISSAALLIHNGEGSDKNPVTLTGSQLYGLAARTTGNIGTVSMTIGDKDSTAKAPSIASGISLSLGSCWGGSTYTVTEGNLTINDGTFGTGVIAFRNVNTAEGKGHVKTLNFTVNGGTFNKYVIGYGSVQGDTQIQTDPKVETLNIKYNGGEFKSVAGAIGDQVYAQDVNLTVNGGTFSQSFFTIYFNLLGLKQANFDILKVLNAGDTFQFSGSTANKTALYDGDKCYGAGVTGKMTINLNGGTFNGGTNGANPFYIENGSQSQSYSVVNEIEINIGDGFTTVAKQGKSVCFAGFRGYGSTCKKLSINVSGTHANHVNSSGSAGMYVAATYLGSGVVIDEYNLTLKEGAMMHKMTGLVSGSNQTIKKVNYKLEAGSACRELNFIDGNLADPVVNDATLTVAGNINVAVFAFKDKYIEGTDTKVPVINSITVDILEGGRIGQFFYHYTDSKKGASKYTPEYRSTVNTMTINNKGGYFGNPQIIQDTNDTIKNFTYNQTAGSLPAALRPVVYHGTIENCTINLSGGTTGGSIFATYGDFGHVDNFTLTTSGTVDMTASSSVGVRVCAGDQVATEEGSSWADRASVDHAVIKYLGGKVPLATGAWYQNSEIQSIKCYVDGATLKSSMYLAGYGGTTVDSELYLISGKVSDAPNLSAGGVTFDANGVGENEVRGNFTNARLYLLGDMTVIDETLTPSTRSATLYVGGLAADLSGENLFWTNGGTIRSVKNGGNYNTHSATVNGNTSFVFSDQDLYLADLDKTIPATKTLTVKANISAEEAYLRDGCVNTFDIADGFRFEMLQSDMSATGEPGSIQASFIRMEGAVTGTVKANYTLNSSKSQSFYLRVPAGTATDLSCETGMLTMTTADGYDSYTFSLFRVAGRTLIYNSTFEVRYLVSKSDYDAFTANGLVLDSFTVSVDGGEPVDQKAIFSTGETITVDGVEYYWVKVTGIAPKDIDTPITLTLSGTMNAAPVVDVYNDSIYAALKQVAGGTGAFADAAKATLEYCQAAADAFEKDAEYWTDPEKAVEDAAAPAEYASYKEGIGDVEIIGTSAVLKDELAIKFWADASEYSGSIDDVTVLINGQDVTASVVKEVNAGVKGYWTFKVDVPVTRMATALTIELYDGGDAISNQYTDSVQNYAVCLIDAGGAYETTDEQKAMGQAILNYISYVNAYLTSLAT